MWQPPERQCLLASLVDDNFSWGIWPLWSHIAFRKKDWVASGSASISPPRDDSVGCPIQPRSWNQEKGKLSTVAESAMKHPLYKVKLAVRTSCAYFDEFELEPRTLSPFEKALSIRMWHFPLGRHPEAPGTTVPTPVITAVLWTSCGFLVQSHLVWMSHILFAVDILSRNITQMSFTGLRKRLSAKGQRPCGCCILKHP